MTRDWWERRARFELFVSQAVLDEAARGDARAAERRLEALAGVQVLGVSSDTSAVARRLLDVGAIPSKAALDAVHIAVAVGNGMDYLLTWNCAHIANAAVRGKIEQTCRDASKVVTLKRRTADAWLTSCTGTARMPLARPAGHVPFKIEPLR